MSYHPRRWIAVCFFVLSTTLNYLDRSLLSVLAPLIKAEFVLSNQQFGWLISAFSIAYAAASLPAGWLLDRLGVTRAVSIAAGLWSAASIGTGLVSSAGTMAFCRGALGVGEAASIPGFGKVNADYLKPEERALGAAVNGVGISIGLAVAPASIGIAAVYGWRTPFMISGLLGVSWIPLWWLISRWIPRSDLEVAGSQNALTSRVRPSWSVLRETPLIALMIANVLWMSGYSLWTNWLTLYLIGVHHVSLEATKGLVWIPPLVSNVGGFFGGWLSMRLVKRKVPVVRARQIAIWVSAIGCLSALGLLLVHSAGAATVFVSASFFFVLAGSVNLYALPIDLYGAGKAGMAVAALTCAYGVLQAVISPVIGWTGDHHLYSIPVWSIAIAPLLASLILLRLPMQPREQI